MANKKPSKSSRKVKDPKAPKRHRSAYILFSIDKRHQIKSENPELSPKEMLLELGALWKTADPQTKQRFQKLSDAEKAEYEAKSNAYKNQQNSENSNSNKNETYESNQSMEINSL